MKNSLNVVRLPTRINQGNAQIPEIYSRRAESRRRDDDDNETVRIEVINERTELNVEISRKR